MEEETFPVLVEISIRNFYPLSFFSQSSAPSGAATEKSIPFLLAPRREKRRNFSFSPKRKYLMSEEVNI